MAEKEILGLRVGRNFFQIPFLVVKSGRLTLTKAKKTCKTLDVFFCNLVFLRRIITAPCIFNL